MGPPRQQANRQTAMIIHLSMILGPILFAGVTSWLRLRPGALPIRVIPGADALRLVSYLMAATAYTIALFLRTRFTPISPSDNAATWWEVQQPRMVLLWSLIEAPMLLGCVVFLLQAHLPTLVAVTGTGLVLLLLTAPGRLSGT
jgi:hypothetical protein